jgi:hypothetical protein
MMDHNVGAGAGAGQCKDLSHPPRRAGDQDRFSVQRFIHCLRFYHFIRKSKWRLVDYNGHIDLPFWK